MKTPTDRSNNVTLVTDNATPKQIAARLVDEVINIGEDLDAGYGPDALAIAAGVVAGKHGLDPAEYVPKLIELVWRSLNTPKPSVLASYLFPETS